MHRYIKKLNFYEIRLKLSSIVNLYNTLNNKISHRNESGINMYNCNGKTVSLVLGSGGARGLAHIVVIRWLEEQGYTISSISGCSMGALVGGIYAAGKLDQFELWARSITKMNLVNLLDMSWKSSGLVKGDKIIHTLTEMVGDLRIKELPYNYTAVATDILNEKEV